MRLARLARLALFDFSAGRLATARVPLLHPCLVLSQELFFVSRSSSRRVLVFPLHPELCCPSTLSIIGLNSGAVFSTLLNPIRPSRDLLFSRDRDFGIRLGGGPKWQVFRCSVFFFPYLRLVTFVSPSLFAVNLTLFFYTVLSYDVITIPASPLVRCLRLKRRHGAGTTTGLGPVV